MYFMDLSVEKLLDIKTLGELKSAGYHSVSIKSELRNNLILKLKKRENPFEGIWGYDETVIPDLERARCSSTTHSALQRTIWLLYLFRSPSMPTPKP